MRRKPGELLPLEWSICLGVAELGVRGTDAVHGYQLAKHIAERENRTLLTAHGTLYRALGRLEAMGLLVSAWEDPAIPARENRPGRRLYQLTPAGKALIASLGKATAAPAARSRRRPALV